jgi:branched-chain amino acid transport system ATP-binding protein
MGVYKRDAGKILFCDEDIAKLKTCQRYRKGLGRTFQLVKLLSKLFVFENAKVGALFGKNGKAMAIVKS